MITDHCYHGITDHYEHTCMYRFTTLDYYEHLSMHRFTLLSFTPGDIKRFFNLVEVKLYFWNKSPFSKNYKTLIIPSLEVVELSFYLSDFTNVSTDFKPRQALV